MAGATIAFTQSISIIYDPMIRSLSEYGVEGAGNKEVTESWDNVQQQVINVV